MSLLGWDDYEYFAEEAAKDEKAGPLVWREITVRVLTPTNSQIHKLEDAYHIDFLSGGWIGYPEECPTCDNVRFKLTIIGKHKYYGDKPFHRNHYCPHCDGGEDVG
jgi:hypothetical protein